MATATLATTPNGSAAPYLLTADEFHRMVAADVLPRGARVELWEGVLFEKMGKNPPHVVSQSKAMAALFRAVPPGWHVAAEAPIEIGQRSVPYPDLAIIRGTADDYASRCPTAADAGLVVEVADSSRSDDLGPVAEIYASGGVAHYWVLDVVDLVLVSHADPREIDGQVRYARIERFTTDSEVALELPGEAPIRLNVADLMPRRNG